MYAVGVAAHVYGISVLFQRGCFYACMGEMQFDTLLYVFFSILKHLLTVLY